MQRNRVTPFGAIAALPGRGDLMGNRGILTGERRWATKAWITCVLSFKGWRAADSRYTPLFFLDEATALAAGHRPCALCRRADFVAFRDAFGATSAPAMDAVLHAERATGERPIVDLDAMPDGAMVAIDAEAWLVVDRSLLRWTDGGYDDVVERPSREVALLTPPSTIAAIRRGYRPTWRPPPHSSG